MRTTIDIPDDILKMMRRIALQQGVPLKKVVSLALRKGLEAGFPRRASSPTYACPTFSMGQPEDPYRVDKALATADALEEEEVVRKLRMRK